MRERAKNKNTGRDNMPKEWYAQPGDGEEQMEILDDSGQLQDGCVQWEDPKGRQIVFYPDGNAYFPNGSHAIDPLIPDEPHHRFEPTDPASIVWMSGEQETISPESNFAVLF